MVWMICPREQALDSPQEKARVANLYEQYNESCNYDFSPAIGSRIS